MQREMIVWHVEDDLWLLDSFARLIGKIEGVKVCSFASYKQVAKHMQACVTPPDLALLDMNLGAGPPGSEVGELIRKNYTADPPEIVFLSAYRETEHLAAGIGLGATAYLDKGQEDIEFILFVVRVLLFRRGLNKLVTDPAKIRQCVTQAKTLDGMQKLLIQDLTMACVAQFFGEGVNLWIENAEESGWFGSPAVTSPWYEPKLVPALRALPLCQVSSCSSLDAAINPCKDGKPDRLVKIYHSRSCVVLLRANVTELGEGKAENLTKALSFFLQPIWVDRLMLMAEALFSEERRRRERIGDTARICCSIARMQSNALLAAAQASELLPQSHSYRRMDVFNQSLQALSEQLTALEQPQGRPVAVSLADQVDNVWGSLVDRFGFAPQFLSHQLLHQVMGNSSDLRSVLRRLLTLFASWTDETGTGPGLELSTRQEGEWVALDLIDRSPRRSRNFLEGMFMPFGQVPDLDDDMEAWLGPALAVMILEERLSGRLEQLTEHLTGQQGHWFRLWLPAAEQEGAQ